MNANRANRANRTNRANNAQNDARWTIVSPPGRGRGPVRDMQVPIYPSRQLDAATRSDIIRFFNRGAGNGNRRVIQSLDVMLLRPARVFNQTGANRWEIKTMRFDTRTTGNRTPQYQLLSNEQRKEVVNFLYPNLLTTDRNANILAAARGAKLICLPECCSFHLMPYSRYPDHHMPTVHPSRFGRTAQEVVEIFRLVARPPKSFILPILTDNEIANPDRRMRCTTKIPAKMKLEMFPRIDFARR